MHKQGTIEYNNTESDHREEAMFSTAGQKMPERSRSGRRVRKEKRKNRFVPAGACLMMICLLCSCGKPPEPETSPKSETGQGSSSAAEREYVTEEEIYRQAVELLCYGDADYRQNKAAKELFEIIRGYKDSEDYLDQIYEVCTKITGERIVSEFVYDEFGHVQLERGNPYYETDDGSPLPDAVTYEYSGGKITAEIYPNGSWTRYAYDPAGRISKMDTHYAGGDSVSYTYEYETDHEGKITKRTAYSEGEVAGERTSEYRIDTDGILSVLQHEEVKQRKPSGKDRLLSFNKKGQLVRVDNEKNYTEYMYSYVWMPERDEDEEFVYEHRIRAAYF